MIVITEWREHAAFLNYKCSDTDHVWRRHKLAVMLLDAIDAELFGVGPIRKAYLDGIGYKFDYGDSGVFYDIDGHHVPEGLCLSLNKTSE